MKMSNFQLVFTGAFVLFILIGVAAFSIYQSGGNNAVGNVTIWGTQDESTFNTVLTTLRSQDKSFQNVVYVQKEPATYESDLVNAMAAGNPPDLFLVSQEELGAFADKVDTIPYSDVPQSTFTQSFIPEAGVFLTPQGSLALPLFVDPLVLYYNRDLLATAGIAQPPQYWNDLLTLAPKITALDSSQNIQKSAVAMGQWTNIPDAKAILSALILQAGDPIVHIDSQSGKLASTFGQTPQGAPENPASSALQFFTEFANPSKTTYSWNRSLPSAPNSFVAGDSALYVGFASEYAELVARNPNLHIGVAVLPQIQGNSTHLTYGTLYGLAVPRNAANPQGALTIAEKLTTQNSIAVFAQQIALPPVRTDVSVDTSGSTAASIFGKSALLARGWLDPNPAATDSLFKTMIDSVVSGGSTPEQAVQDAAQGMQSLLGQ